MMTDRLVAVVAIICASVVATVLLVVLGYSATHEGDVLVLSTAVGTVLGAVSTALAKAITARKGTTDPPAGS